MKRYSLLLFAAAVLVFEGCASLPEEWQQDGPAREAAWIPADMDWYGFLPVEGQRETIDYLYAWFAGEDSEVPHQVDSTDNFRLFQRGDERYILMRGRYSAFGLKAGLTLSSHWIRVDGCNYPIWRNESGFYLTVLSSLRLLISLKDPTGYLNGLLEGNTITEDHAYYGYLKEEKAHLVNTGNASAMVAERINLSVDLPLKSVYLFKTGDRPFSLELGLEADSESAARGLDVVYRMYLLQMRLSGSKNGLEEELMSHKPERDGSRLSVPLENITFENLKEWGILP